MENYTIRIKRRCLCLCYMVLFGMALSDTPNQNDPLVSKDVSLWHKILDERTTKIISLPSQHIKRDSSRQEEWRTIRKIEIQNDATGYKQGIESRSISEQLQDETKCQSQSKMRKVTLLMVSPLQLTEPRSLYRFDVDSAIFELRIQVNGSDPASTPIINPMGEIHQRVKRDTLNERRSTVESKHHKGIKRHVTKETRIFLHPPKHQFHPSNNSNDENSLSQTPFKHRIQPVYYQDRYNQYRLLNGKLELDKYNNRRKNGRFSSETKDGKHLQNGAEKLKNGQFFNIYITAKQDQHIQNETNMFPRNMTEYNSKNLLGHRHSANNMVNVSKINIKGRHRRRATMMTLKTAFGMAIWAIEPPMPGTWGFSMNGPEVTHVKVTAFSQVDFHFEFLDIMTMKGIDAQPVASDTTLARIYVTGTECVTNITLLHFQNEAGETIMTTKLDDPYMTQDLLLPETETGMSSSLIYTEMPDVPFYMALSGYDSTGMRFHRICMDRVVPHIFVISLVDYKADPLVPGSDYKFGLRIRNKGKQDLFEVTAQFEDSDIFTAKTVPNVLPVRKDGIAHIAVIVNVTPAIKFIIRGAMTIMVRRVSDNTTAVMTETVTAMPMSFKIDYEAPSCKIVSKKGGCSTELSCHKQHWQVTMAVTDSMTGVKSAVFDNTPLGAFTKVQFSFSMSNRTALVEYGYNCCYLEASIHVTDYANNAVPCPIKAPWLPSPSNYTFNFTTTTNTTISPTSKTNTSLATTPPITSTATTPKNSQSPSSRKSTTKSRPTSSAPKTVISSKTPSQTRPSTRSTPSRKPTRKLSQGKNTSATKVPSASSKVTQSTSSSNSHSSVSEPPSSTTINNGVGAKINGTARNRDSSDGQPYSTLRLVAIIMGCIGGSAALAIILVCLAYKCLYKHGRVRRSSIGSDVTMGSSWESRSDGSLGADSLRLQGLVESTESSSSRSETDCLRSRYSNDGSEVLKVGFAGVADDIEGAVRNGSEKKWGDFNQVQFDDSFNDEGMWRKVKTGDNDSYTVYVKVNKEGSQTSTASSTGGSNGGASCEDEEDHSLRLETAGKIYISMIEIQKRMEEMEGRRISLAHNQNQPQSASVPVDNDNIRNCAERSNPRPPRVRNVARPRLVYRDETPPGSPKIDNPISLCEDEEAIEEGGGVDLLCHSYEDSIQGEQHFNGGNSRLESSRFLPYSVRRNEEYGFQTGASAATDNLAVHNSSCLHAPTSNTSATAPSTGGHVDCKNSPYKSSRGISNQNQPETLTVHDQPLPWRADGSPRNLTPPELRRHVLEQNFNAQHKGSPLLKRHESREPQPFRISFPLQRNTETAISKPSHQMPGKPNSKRVVFDDQEHGRYTESGASSSGNDNKRKNSKPTDQNPFKISEKTKSKTGVLYNQSNDQIHLAGTNSTDRPGDQRVDSTDRLASRGAQNSIQMDARGASNSVLFNSNSANSMARHSPTVDMSEIDQMAIRNDLQHIRDRLLRFHRRIDEEIEEEERKSRTQSTSSGNHDDVQDGD